MLDNSTESNTTDTKAELVKEAHRRVFEAITQLIDVVEDEFLYEKLHLLDASSWDEIIEERYLGNLCGYPSCSGPVQRQESTGRRYKIDRREKKIYTAIPLYEKFCSITCYKKSCHLKQQLYEEPLWFNLERKSKQYCMDMPVDEKQQRRVEAIFVDETDKLLLTRLNEMKISDNAASSEDESDCDNLNDGDENIEKSNKRTEDDQFLSEIRSFVTSVANMSAKSTANTMGLTSKVVPRVNVKQEPKKDVKIEINNVENEKTISYNQMHVNKPQSVKPLNLSEQQIEEKLAKLRAKHGKTGNQTLRKVQLIDAPRLSPEKASKLSEDLR